MDDVRQLEELSLVSKVCTEVENHLGVNDKKVAEMFIALAGKHTTVEKFKAALSGNGGEDLSVSAAPLQSWLWDMQRNGCMVCFI